MRRGECLHNKSVKLDGLTSPVLADIMDGAHTVMGSGCLQCLLGDMHWESELAVKDTHAPGVIPVVMRNQQGIDLSNRMAVSGKSFLCLVATDAGVHKQLHVPSPHVSAIPVASRIQRDDLHADTLTARGR
jgi:hypothetical protein